MLPPEALIRLNPSLDIPALKKDFAIARSLHIPGILTDYAAERTARCLAQDVDWHLVFNEGKKSHTLYPDQFQGMTTEQHKQLRQKVLKGAQAGFQFIYNYYNIYDYYLNGKNMDHFLHRFHEFLNSAPFLDFIKEITGKDTIAFADSQATAYGPGHFLTMHHGQVEGKNRKLAYVFNFTRKWKMDWGGILQFLGDDGNIKGGFIPTFNALNLFEVPQNHSVSYVSPFCPATRYAITGWLRESEGDGKAKKESG